VFRLNCQLLSCGSCIESPSVAKLTIAMPVHVELSPLYVINHVRYSLNILCLSWWDLFHARIIPANVVLTFNSIGSHREFVPGNNKDQFSQDSLVFESSIMLCFPAIWGSSSCLYDPPSGVPREGSKQPLSCNSYSSPDHHNKRYDWRRLNDSSFMC
jgi:hypothetical protein